MPIFQWRCRDCRAIHEQFLDREDPARLAQRHCSCGGTLVRKFSFSAAPVFEGYFDVGIGAYVNSKADLDEKCRIQSEKNTARNGIPSDIRAYDRRDMTPEDLGVTDDGMGATHDQAVKDGRIDQTGKIVF